MDKYLFSEQHHSCSLCRAPVAHSRLHLEGEVCCEPAWWQVCARGQNL